MRLLTTGIDANGKSCLVSATDVTAAPVPGMDGTSAAHLFHTTECPPAPRPPSDAENIEVRLPPGLVRWQVVEHAPLPPGSEESHAAVLHTTDKIDLVYIVSGTCDLILEDGVHATGPGDCIVMAGTAHGMVPGAEGCQMLSFGIGMPPPA